MHKAIGGFRLNAFLCEYKLINITVHMKVWKN